MKDAFSSLAESWKEKTVGSRGESDDARSEPRARKARPYSRQASGFAMRRSSSLRPELHPAASDVITPKDLHAVTCK